MVRAVPWTRALDQVRPSAGLCIIGGFERFSKSGLFINFEHCQSGSKWKLLPLYHILTRCITLYHKVKGITTTKYIFREMIYTGELVMEAQ